MIAVVMRTTSGLLTLPLRSRPALRLARSPKSGDNPTSSAGSAVPEVRKELEAIDLSGGFAVAVGAPDDGAVALQGGALQVELQAAQAAEFFTAAGSAGAAVDRAG